MLSRISSGFLQLTRTLSRSRRPEQEPSASTGETPTNSNANQEPSAASETPATTQPPLSDERQEFEKTLNIVKASTVEPPQDAPELPYTLAEGYVINRDGHLSVYANTGFVANETPIVHTTLRENPAVAAVIVSIVIDIQGPAEIDLVKRDTTAATQRKGLAEWSKTLPALKNLQRCWIRAFSSSGNGSFYVPGEDSAELGAPESERGLMDVSMIVKSLAWYSENLEVLELCAVDVSEEAARAFEGHKLTHLEVTGCPTRVLSIIPRLSSLAQLQIDERGDYSMGADYLGLMTHVKSTLQQVYLHVRGPKLDLHHFLMDMRDAPLNTVGIVFTTHPPLSQAEVSQKLREAFPAMDGKPLLPKTTSHPVAEASEATTKAASDDMELDSTVSDADNNGKPTSSGDSTPQRKAGPKRSALVEKRKDELKASEAAASKEKRDKITGAGGRKLRSTPLKQK